MIKKITIKNHPFFEDVELELKETNFLIGNNRVGKSLFMSHFARQDYYKDNTYDEKTNTFLFDGKKSQNHWITSKKRLVEFIRSLKVMGGDFGYNINSHNRTLNVEGVGDRLLKNFENFQIHLNLDSEKNLDFLLNDKMDKFRSRGFGDFNTYTLFNFTLANKIAKLKDYKLILLEDPEIYAHPNAQKEIVDKLFFEIKVQKIISTH